MHKPWSEEITSIVSNLKTNSQHGLSSKDIEDRFRQFGPNEVATRKKASRLLMLLKQFNNPVVYILVAAFIITLILKEYLDAVAIMSIVILNGIIGFFQEHKAEASLEALADLSAPKARVLRDSKIIQVESSDVYPGDILILEAGDYVVADARLVSANQFSADESILTGESLAVQKNENQILTEDTPFADQVNMVFAGTAISTGTGKAVVVSTGIKTQMGKIAELLEETETSSTPLQMRLEKVSHMLLYLGIGVIVLVVILGGIKNLPWIDITMSALSLSIAAIPEGLMTIVTIALVMAVNRMSQKKALVRKLTSVETLGTTDIICTDKTGTLTTGRMEVRNIFAENEEMENLLNLNMGLCNNASIEGAGSGDTTEIALLNYVEKNFREVHQLRNEYPRLYEWSFDSDRKRMSVAVVKENSALILVKGAPESLLSLTTLDSSQLKLVESKVSEFSQKGMRVLCYAFKIVPLQKFHEMSFEDVEHNLTFCGLSALADPPRTESIEAIKKCKEAGIRIIMITGDHPQTAKAIAEEIGIHSERVLTGKEIDTLTPEEFSKLASEVSIYARVSPEHKLKLVQALKNKQHVVAMTGDGVNDAPALKHASIGVSMGKGGTEVARQASSLVLTDDNFATIVDAVEEGRAVHGNIKRTLQYLLSTNLGELIFILSAAIIGMPVPLLPINLLWLNLVSDGLPSLALAAEKVPVGFLQSSERSSISFFDKGFLQEMFFVGSITSLISLLVYHYSLENFDSDTARSIAFSFLVYIVLFRSFSCRSETKTFMEMKPNWYHLGSVFFPLLFQVFMQESEVFRRIFKIVPIPLEYHLILLGLSLIPVTMVEVFKIWRRK